MDVIEQEIFLRLIPEIEIIVYAAKITKDYPVDAPGTCDALPLIPALSCLQKNLPGMEATTINLWQDSDHL